MIAVARQSRPLRRPYRRFILSKVGECLYRSPCGSYFAVVKHQGKQYRRSLKTTDRGIARKKLAEFRQQLRGSVPAAHAAATTLTFDQLAKRWLDTVAVHLKPSTHSRRCGVVKVGLGRFRKKPANKISKLDCEQWATSRSKQVKGRTFNYELETLSLIFKYGISHGLLPDNPAAGIRHRRLDTAAVVIPSRQQFCRLIADMRQRTTESADIVEFLAYSGCRSGESREVRWGDLDFEAKTLRIAMTDTETKKHTRTIPLFAPLERLLRDMLARLPHPPKPSDYVLSSINPRWALQTACRRLGLPMYDRKVWRHFFCSTAVSCGADVLTVAKWAGHRDAQMICRVYGHATEEHSELMAKRMVFDAPWRA